MQKKYPLQEERIIVPRFRESEGFYTTEERSSIMSKIKGKNTKPELLFRKKLWEKGIRYRVSDKSIPGKPDISNKSKKLAIFIDGEFWHGHNWAVKKHAIKSNRDFWLPKIERNIQRDREVNLLLKEKGYRVFRFWAADIKKQMHSCINEVCSYVSSMS